MQHSLPNLSYKVQAPQWLVSTFTNHQHGQRLHDTVDSPKGAGRDGKTSYAHSLG